MELVIQKDIGLSGYTTIGLGGKAKYFVSCKSCEDIIEAIKFAKDNELKFEVFSGGSNVIFSDEGFDGVVAKIDMKGVKFAEEGEFVFANVKAGENWDDFVRVCVNNSLSGVECLSGIPGSAGATPIQNVGAYGQEVSEVIESIEAIERASGLKRTFSNDECDFDYRDSRFKAYDKDAFIITAVKFRFRKNSAPVIKYSELKNKIDEKRSGYEQSVLKEKLILIRNSVLELRKKKSMVIDKSDPNSRSCGSFFKNPIVDQNQFLDIQKNGREVPHFLIDNKYKIPAAWLIENAGFHKGYIKGGVGISQNHSLALINIKGTATELLVLADEIEVSVKKKFGIKLEKEPVFVF